MKNFQNIIKISLQKHFCLLNLGRHSEVSFLGAKPNPMALSVEGEPARAEAWLSNTEQVLTVAEPPLTYYLTINTCSRHWHGMI